MTLIHKDSISTINFLMYKPENFVAWICPLLKATFIQDSHFIQNEEEIIESIFFLKKGHAGYVLQFIRNIVYIELHQGDDFGQIDIMQCGIQHSMTIVEILNHNELLTRHFTVQALCNTEVLALSVKDLHKMSQIFVDAFQSIFADGEVLLRRTLN